MNRPLGKRDDTALLILNPRRIPECIEALEGLDVPKCWLSYMPEVKAAACANRAIQETSYARYVVISDDTVPTQDVLDVVLDLHDLHPEACVTGYCNLDSHLPFVNLTWAPLHPPPPTVGAYKFSTRREADEGRTPFCLDGVITSTFAGLSLTVMTREMWLRFPLRCTEYGGQMDYQLSWELQEAGLPIYAPVGAFVRHVKETWNEFDKSPEKLLLVGARPPAVTWTDVRAVEPLESAQ